MARQKKKGRWIVRLLLFMLLLAALAIAWFFLSPTLMTAQNVTEYLPYTVQTRDIFTSLSFSGTAEILHSQQISATEGAFVRDVFVKNNQTVKKDDKLVQLEGGDVLTANMDGVVNQVRARKGEYAVPGQSLVEVCDLTNLQITMSVDEYDISTLSVSQPCQLYFLALGETFDGEISHINRVSTSSGTSAYYTVSVELTAPDRVLPGMQVCVTIPQQEALNVQALPIEAVSFDQGQPYVYLSRNNEMVRETVALGLNDGQYVQILSSLPAGETVYAVKTTTESPETITLSGLYERIFGKRIVINEPGQANGKEGINEKRNRLELPFSPEEDQSLAPMMFPDDFDPSGDSGPALPFQNRAE